MTTFPVNPVEAEDCQQNWEFLQKGLNVNSQFQAGDLKSTFATTAPNGWILLIGQTINPIETVYPDLAKALGVTGSVTFPDGRGRAIIGAGTGAGLTGRTIRSTGGTEPSNMPAHTHNWSESGFGLSIFNAALPAGGTGTYQRGGSPGTLAVTDSAGGGSDNMMPWLAANIMMKVLN